MRKIAVVLLCWMLAGFAHAGTEAVARRQIESSMLVSGMLSVDAGGAVTAHTLDRRDELPPPVAQFLDQALPQFRFKPAEHDGRAQPVQAQMSLQVVVNQIDPQHVALRLRSARFTEVGPSTAEAVSPPKTDLASIAHRASIHYPDDAMRAAVSGTVYVAVRFDRGGQVIDAEAQQVNLKITDSESKMRHWRDVLGRSTVAAVRRFTFQPPTTGPHAGDASFTGILPVAFFLDGARPPRYGEWDSYVLGPKQDIAWLHGDDDRDADNSEAVPDGQFAMTGDSLQLLTPLGG
jgi:hypothetical protein